MSVTNWDQMNNPGRPGEPAARPRRGDPALDLGPGGAVEAVVAVPQLMACFEQCRRRGGRAPGPDGLRHADFGRQESARALAAVRDAVLSSRYAAPPSRRVEIPKRGGLRRLTLDVVTHRALAASALNVLGPALEKSLSTVTHSACGRGVHTMLRELHRAAGTGHYGVLLNHDVKSAFPSLPLTVALHAYRRSISCPRLLALIELLLRGGDDPDRTIGIPQGLALSPLTLDLSMSWDFDRHWPKTDDSLVALRYVDNLAVLCATTDDGRRAAGKCRALLGHIGLTLKDLPEETYLCDLRAGGVSELLGFNLSLRNGKLTFELSQAARDSLASRLTQARSAPDPLFTSHSLVTGWISAMGARLR